jgi:hypothetical protein
VFDPWQRLRKGHVAVDFRSILKLRPGHPCFKDSVFDHTELDVRADSIGGEMALIVVKSIPLSDLIAKSQTESEIANSAGLRCVCWSQVRLVLQN